MAVIFQERVYDADDGDEYNEIEVVADDTGTSIKVGDRWQDISIELKPERIQDLISALEKVVPF